MNRTTRRIKHISLTGLFTLISIGLIIAFVPINLVKTGERVSSHALSPLQIATITAVIATCRREGRQDGRQGDETTRNRASPPPRWRLSRRLASSVSRRLVSPSSRRPASFFLFPT